MEATAQVLGGNAKAREYRAGARQAEQQARDVDLQALQASEQRREALNGAIATVDARRSAAGLSLDSPTAMAIERETRRQSVRGEQINRLGSLNQSSALRLQASSMRSAAKTARLIGFLNAGTSIQDNAAKAMSAGAA
jgi:hypothetical protein